MSQPDFGPLNALLDDGAITEIMVNGPDAIYIERRGQIEKVDARFDDEAHLMAVIRQIVEPFGRRVDESHPIVDVRLPDASRVHVVIPPIAISGPSLTIRKLMLRHITLDDLIGWGSLSRDIADFLRACVIGRQNIVISGGTGSGKTTLMNVLCGFIPDSERLVVLQHDAELRLNQPHLVILETRPANLEGQGEVTMRQLVDSAVKMRPDRILAAEIFGGEAWDMFQAMNTGHDGSIISLHANSPLDALMRLEIMATEANPSLPLLSLRQQMASAIDIIVQQMRLHDGRRRVTKITEVLGSDGGIIQTRDLFEFVQTGITDGHISGEFRATGHVPYFMGKPEFQKALDAAGIRFSASLFAPTQDVLRFAPPMPPVPPVPPMPPMPPKRG